MKQESRTCVFLLGALASAAAAAVDTSGWTCEKCPFPSGTSGSVEVGVGAVSDASAKFGDWSGLHRQGAHAVLGATASTRSNSGYYADLWASDLGLDSRALAARSGMEGRYALRLGYAEIPRHFADGAATPYAGEGGEVLTLPPSASLRPLDLGLKYKRYELGGSLNASERWTWRVSLRRDERDGTRGIASSFFASAAQLAAPVDQATDRFEVAAAYASGRLQATLAYQLAQFRNGSQALVWDNPFAPVVPGATQGRLALAPDNKFEQISGSAGYDPLPWVRLSADFALGRMTQDEPFVPSTVNGVLAPGALPAASLDGRVDTFSGNLRASATPIDGLRLHALLSRDVRDNRTEVRSWPQVATDMFPTDARSNTPFGFWRDRVKLGADWRGPGGLRLSGGFDHDRHERRYAEVVTTREARVWGRVGAQPLKELSLSVELAHSERDNSPYGVATWFGAPESPLLRKYDLADRTRDTLRLRADLALGEQIGLGLSADVANDDYADSVVGLTAARNAAVGADLSYALSDATRLHAFAQREDMRSRQSGSQSGLAADWRAQVKDRFEVLGLGVKHAAMAGKLELGADLVLSRARSALRVDAGVADPPFPAARTDVDSVRLYADYKLNDKLSLLGRWWYEDHAARDWRLDGVLPTTVSNLLAFGQEAPRYRVHVASVALRLRF